MQTLRVFKLEMQPLVVGQLRNNSLAYYKYAIVVASSEDEARLYHPFAKDEGSLRPDPLTVVWDEATRAWWQATRAEPRQLVNRLGTELDPYWGWCAPSDLLVSEIGEVEVIVDDAELIKGVTEALLCR